MRASSILLAAVTLTACGPMDLPQGADERGTSASALGMTGAEETVLLAWVNYPGTDLATLDKKAGINSRAAQNIIAHRNGADGLALTADDNLFGDLAELDLVSYVGDSSLIPMLKYAKANPAPGAEVVEGVAFTGWESASVVWAVNSLSASSLDAVLDARAAANLVAARPFTSVAKMGPVALVGPSALKALQAHARGWWTAMSKPAATLGGTFDGVSFDEATAVKALDLANTAAREAMMLGGVNGPAAAAIVGNRPYATLKGVSEVAGVGPATMQELKALATAPAADPLQALKDTLAPLTADLWFPSETDARLLFVSSPNIGSAPITESLIRTRLASQHDALLPQVMYVDPSETPLYTRTQVEELNANDYLNHLINAADPNDPDSLARAARLATLRDALNAQLSDLKIFRFGRISISVFIVGRTPNGDLAGLLTGQVET